MIYKTFFFHKFNRHDKCDSDWCSVAAHIKSKSGEPCDSSSDIFAGWEAADLIKDNVSSQKNHTKPPTDAEWNDLFGKLKDGANLLARDAEGLIENKTTNISENKFSIRSIMLPKNMCSSRAGGFHTAVGLSNLRLSLGTSFTTHILEKLTNKEPEEQLQKYLKRKKNKFEKMRMYKNNPKTKARRRKLKQRSTGARKAKGVLYGDSKCDLPQSELIIKIERLRDSMKQNYSEASEQSQNDCNAFLKEVLSDCGMDSYMEVKKLVCVGDSTKRLSMVNQRKYYDEWKLQRYPLLTSSNFGKVLSKKQQTCCSSLVDDMLYSRPIDHLDAVQWGKDNEQTAINSVETIKSVKIYDCLGLFQFADHPHLAATPDGLVYSSSKPLGQQWGVLEVKCPFSSKDTTPKDTQKGKALDKEGKLKKNHPWYKQIIGQMGCIGVTWGIFAIWTPKETHIEEISFDSKLWAKWIPKLDLFWTNALAPELEDPRVTRFPSQPIRRWCFQDGEVYRK